MKTAIKVLLISSILSVFGCASVPMKGYEGELKSPDNTALLKSGSLLKFEAAPILSKIDGKINKEPNPILPTTYNTGWKAHKLDVVLVAGLHELELGILTGQTIFTGKTVRLKYSFEAGKEYLLKADKEAVSLSEKKGEGMMPVNAVVKDVPTFVDAEENRPHALLVEDGNNENGIAFVFNIDGVPGPKFCYIARFNDGWNGKFETRLTPGKHRITYSVMKDSAYSEIPETREFNFEAGKKYMFVVEKNKIDGVETLTDTLKEAN